MDFEEFTQQYDEEWKKFPTDRVNRQIDKAKAKRDDLYKLANNFSKKFPVKGDDGGSSAAKLSREKAHEQESRRHRMTGVKNHRTKMTDEHKAKQKFVGKDNKKTQQKIDKHADTALSSDKTGVYRRNEKKHNTLIAVANSNLKQTKTDNKKQAAANKSDKEARRKAKSSMTRTKLEKLYKKESMNYSEYLEHLDAAQNPLYKVEGKLPQCPPGYVWSRERKDCIPKTDKDKISGKLQDNKDNKPQAQYNVWGRTGLNGDGYAYEEPFVRNVGDSGEVA